MSKLRFEEEKLPSSLNRVGKENDGLINLLVKKRLAKNQSSARKILLFIFLIAVILTFFVFAFFGSDETASREGNFDKLKKEKPELFY